MTQNYGQTPSPFGLRQKPERPSAAKTFHRFAPLRLRLRRATQRLAPLAEEALQ